MKEYRVSLGTQLRYAWYYIPLVLIFVAVLLLFPSLSEKPSAWPWIISLTLICIVVPHVLLHLRYLILSRGQGTAFDSAGRAIAFRGPDGELTISYDDILEVQVTRSPTLKRGSPIWFPWQSIATPCLSYEVVRGC